MIPKIPTTPHGDGPPLVVNPGETSALLFNTMVVYGPTGSRKTSQIRAFAKYIYEKTGKKTRLITMDGGGYGTAQDYVNAGIIEPWRLVEEANPKVAIIKASRGAWPEKLVGGLRTSSNLIEVPKGQAAKHLKDVGAYVIEGWYSIAMAVIRDAVSKGTKISEEIVGRFTESLNGDGNSSESFGAPSRSHYGFVQNFTLDYIRNFSALPLERVMYTSLEGKGEDKIDKTLKYGPAVAGGAITAAIPAYVGDCIHFEDYVKDTKTQEMEVRAWFQQHPDAENPRAIWPAKARIIPSRIQEFKSKMGKDGYFVLGDNSEPDLGTYLRVQDEMLASSTDEIVQWKKMIDEKRKEDK
jgi:hypothetical protein